MKRFCWFLIAVFIFASVIFIPNAGAENASLSENNTYSAECVSEQEEASDIDYYGRGALASLYNADALLFAYDSLAAGIEQSAEEISVKDYTHSLTADEVRMVFDAYRRDHTEHFWLGNSYSIVSSSETKEIISIKPSYIMSGDVLEQAKAEFERAIDELLLLVEGVSDEFECELILHDALASRITYTSGADNAHNSYGAVVEGLAVCEGYAEALQYLLLRSGIQSFIVTGASINPSTGNSEGHAWNLVRIDGEYYHTDLTWDDQGTYIYHAYFNQPESIFLEDHIIDDTAYGLPVCNSTKASYFSVKEGAISGTDYDASEIGRLLRENSFRAHVYIEDGSDAIADFIDWYYNQNINEIAKAAGVGGSFTYGYSKLGREIVLILNPSAMFSGVSLSIGSSMSLRYYVRADDDEIFDMGRLAVKFTVFGNSVMVDTYTKVGEEYVFVFDGIPFDYMCEQIDASLLLVSGASKLELNSKNDYSVEKYCKELLEEYKSDELIYGVVSNLLTLGRAAQCYLSTNTDNLPAEGMTLAPTDELPSEENAALILGDESSECQIQNISVTFDGEVSIYVDVYSSSDSFTLLIDGVGIPSSLAESSGNGLYRFSLDATEPAAFARFYHIELKYSDELVASAKYSVYSYVYMAVNNENTSDAEHSLALAVYRLGKSANAYALLQKN